MTHPNPQKHRESQHRWYMNNRERLIPIAVARKKIYYTEKVLWLKELKGSLCCIKCGEDHFACLDFHHRDPNEKEETISKIIWHWGKKRILEEIAKCDVLCSNCHRKEHWEEN